VFLKLKAARRPPPPWVLETISLRLEHVHLEQTPTGLVFAVLSSSSRGEADIQGVATMICKTIVGAAIAAAAVATAHVAEAAPPDEVDVPGMHYNAVYGGPCDNFDRYIFGRAPNGQALACVASDDNKGSWVLASPLRGVQQIGAPCGDEDGAAQSPDGRPLICVSNQGWQPGP
jgi:hypothetical protein